MHSSTNKSADPTHGGAVVFRMNQGSEEYLLIRPSNGSLEWVLPKGHCELSEQSWETALREVREETGVVGGILAALHSISFTTEKEEIRADFFLVCAFEIMQSPEGREMVWLPFAQAFDSLTFEESKELLEKAEKKRITILPARKE